jgi:metal-responsive CopG/Arc/MetJ family transcriptional regulator
VKARVSITLPEELLKAIDKRAKQQEKTRSNVIEGAVRAFIAQSARDEQNARDLEIINRHADRLNREAHDMLEYLQR